MLYSKKHIEIFILFSVRDVFNIQHADTKNKYLIIFSKYLLIYFSFHTDKYYTNWLSYHNAVKKSWIDWLID